MFDQRKQLDELGRKVKALGEDIPVNLGLKSRLRTGFESRPLTRGKPIPACLAVLTVAMVLALWLGWGNREPGQLNPVLAADLKIINQVSVVDIASGNNLPPVIGKDHLYIPVVGKGTYYLPLQSSKTTEVKRITDGNILFAALSHDGQTAAYINSKGIYLYDLKKGKTKTLIEGNDYDLYYEEPCWSTDDSTLLITRRQIEWLEHGHSLKSLDIYEIGRNGKSLKKITSGSQASYIPRSKDILLERDGKVLIKKADGEEQIVDEGRFPSLSPDGFYIAYVKSIRERKDLNEFAQVITDIPDVYICSVNNFADRRKLTANYPYRHTNEEEWAQGLDPAHGEQALSFSGMYDFYNPVWGTDSGTLYVLNGGNSENIPLRITRIDLSPETLAAEDTVARYLEAGITRDDGFARSLLTHPSDYLSVSNPHPVAYSVAGSGKEDGKTYVDAWRTVAYNADSYYMRSQVRFYLEEGTEGYKIGQTIGREGRIQVLGRGDGIYLREGDKERILLPVKGLTPPGGKAMRRLSALAYSPEKGLLLYTIQEHDSFTFIAHDLKQNKEVFSQRIADGESAVMDVSFDGIQQYAAVRYYGDHQSLKIYDVRKKNMVPVPFLDDTTNAFWAGSRLLVEKAGLGGTVRWRYDPQTAMAILGG